MKKVTVKPSKRHVLYIVLATAIIATAAYTVWQTWLMRDDIGQLYTKVYDDPNYIYDESYSEKAPDSNISYKILKQYTETLDVANPDSYSAFGDLEYITKNVRVVELEVTNNEDIVYSAYNSIGTVDENGKLIRTHGSIRSSQDKNFSANGYGLELIPGGKGVIYLYFEDEGTEITRLYNIDNSKELILN